MNVLVLNEYSYKVFNFLAGNIVKLFLYCSRLPQKNFYKAHKVQVGNVVTS